MQHPPVSTSNGEPIYLWQGLKTSDTGEVRGVVLGCSELKLHTDKAKERLVQSE